MSVSGRDAQRTARAAGELGFERSTTSWEAVVDDPEVEVVAVLGANPVHLPATLGALRAGKPVLCEKPLGSDGGEAARMLAAASAAGGTHACGFNYRWVPAVRLLFDVLRQGRIGALRHFRGLYLQDWANGERTRSTHGGAGAVLDYSHLVDMLRHLAGEPLSVSAQVTSFGSGAAEDAFAAALELPGGALATLEASRYATGWKGHHRIELNGTDGAAWWDMEDPNRLHLFLAADERDGLGGHRAILVTEPRHPFLESWWPPGHVLGWEHSFVHQWRAFLGAVERGEPVPPEQASFEDGMRAAMVCDAILASARLGERVRLEGVG